MEPRRELTSALLLDFDNVYISLEKISAAAAERLLQRMDAWLEWFRAGLHTGEEAPQRRRLVMQRCYLNPQSFGRQRLAFTRGGFEVIDCPALTRAAKNSADITMVIDVMDALSHPTRIDEFIILSADADFTPLLYKIRLHDRLAVVYSNQVTAAALRNSASMLVDQDRFLEEALGFDDTDDRPSQTSQGPRFSSSDDEIRHVSGLLERRLRESGPIAAADLGGALKQQYRQFDGSQWLGTGGVNALIDRIGALNPRIEVSGEIGDRVLKLRLSDLSAPAREVLSFIRESVAASPVPIVAAKVATDVEQKFGTGPRESKWFNQGSLRDLVQSAAVDGLEFDPTPPGYVLDRARHASGDGVAANLSGLPQPLIDFIEMINDATGWPKLAPTQLDLIFSVGAEVVREGVADRNGLGKTIRDRIDVMVESGAVPASHAVSRTAINFILTAIMHADRNYADDCATEAGFRQAALDGFIGIYETRIGEMTDDQKSDTGTALFSVIVPESDDPEAMAEDAAPPEDQLS